jgi:hypothetical protein
MISLEDQIRARYKADQEAQPRARTPDEIPISYESITDEWLTAILFARHPGAHVVRHRLGAPDNGTNNRRRIFLEFDAAGTAAGLPASVFCKATHDLRNRLVLGHSGAVLCEVTFYNHARPLLEIEAPEAWFAAFDPVSFNSMIMLKDLGEGVSFFPFDRLLRREQAESQISLLAGLHGRFYEARELTTTLAVLPTWRERFRNLERFHLEECCASGFRAAEPVIPGRLFAREAQIWRATVETVVQHDALPTTLCHGDVHLKNWYLNAEGRVGLGDWGVAHRGHWARDLAYTIATALPVEIRRQWERDLVALYLEEMAGRGVIGLTFDEAWLRYRQALFSALAFWTMTLTPAADMPDMQPEDVSLEFVKRLAHAIDDNDALASLEA